MNLSDIKLTKQDFDMLIEGLSLIPGKHNSFDIMKTLLTAPMNSDKNAFDKWEADREREIIKRKKESVIDEENATILKAKLIQLRRYMEENNLLLEAQDIIDSAFKKP